MSEIARRHHYLPKFFIKGFISPFPKLWVYNKFTDTIESKQKSPKYIFYEWNSNNIKIEEYESDILETKIYNKIDNLLAQHFKIIQSANLEEVEHQDLVNRIILMMIVGYYRVPANKNWTTQLTDDIINNKLPENRKEIIQRIYELKINIQDKNKMISSIAVFLNFFATQERLLKGKQNYKIVESPQTSFILSDNPVIYEFLPTDFNELSSSAIFPLTEKRAYFGLKHTRYTFDTQIIKQINIFLALQAKQYFGSTNKIFLKEVSTAYKIMKPFEQELTQMKKQLFENINR